MNLVFPTGHAIGLTTENGAELLIHIGMDTVSLAGKGFKTYVEAGDVVEAGQKLIEFDLATIRDAKLPVITPIIVTNTAEFDDVLTTKELVLTPVTISSLLLNKKEIRESTSRIFVYLNL